MADDLPDWKGTYPETEAGPVFRVRHGLWLRRLCEGRRNRPGPWSSLDVHPDRRRSAWSISVFRSGGDFSGESWRTRVPLGWELAQVSLAPAAAKLRQLSAGGQEFPEC